MPYLNQASLLGHAGKDAEKKYLSNGTLTTKFSLATSEYYQKDGEWKSNTEWHNIVVFGDKAERASEIKKGDLVLVVGKIHNRSWTNPDGTKGYMTEINASKVSFGTRKEDESEGGTPEESQGGESVNTADTTDDLPF